MAAKAPETDAPQDGDTKTPPAAAPSQKPKTGVAELKKVFEPAKKPPSKAVAAHVNAVKKLRGKLDPIMTEAANGTTTPDEDAPADDADEEDLVDHVQEQLEKTAEELEKRAEEEHAKKIREEQARLRVALANRRQKGVQCTYVGARGVQHLCFPQNPTAHGRCKAHAESRSYAKCTIDNCEEFTRSELGICSRCQTRATAARNRAQDREIRSNALKWLLKECQVVPDFDKYLAMLATGREINEARTALKEADE